MCLNEETIYKPPREEQAEPIILSSFIFVKSCLIPFLLTDGLVEKAWTGCWYHQNKLHLDEICLPTSLLSTSTWRAKLSPLSAKESSCGEREWRGLKGSSEIKLCCKGLGNCAFPEFILLFHFLLLKSLNHSFLGSDFLCHYKRNWSRGSKEVMIPGEQVRFCWLCWEEK